MRIDTTRARERFDALAADAPALAFLADLFDDVAAKARDLTDEDLERFLAQALRDKVHLADLPAHVAYACAVLTALLKQHLVELREKGDPLSIH